LFDRIAAVRAERPLLRQFTAVLIAVGTGALLPACSPYVYSDSVQTLNSKMHAIDSSYQDNAQKILAERQLTDRIKWVSGRTALKLGTGCAVDPDTTAEACTLTSTAAKKPALVAVDTAVKPARNPKSAPQVCKPPPVPVSSPQAQSNPAVKELTPTQLIMRLDNYAAALAAVTKAQDRADFDNAAARVSAAVGALPGPYGPPAKAGSSALLWLVGQDLDHRRLEELRNATEAACQPVHDLSDALGAILKNQRGDRLDGLHELMRSKILALDDLRTTPHVTDAAYAAAIDDVQATVDAYETVRATDPKGAAQALSNAHDALVLAVRNNDGQIDALINATQVFAQSADAMAAAAATPSAKKS
jgi:hypothetical protein